MGSQLSKDDSELYYKKRDENLEPDLLAKKQRRYTYSINNKNSDLQELEKSNNNNNSKRQIKKSKDYTEQSEDISTNSSLSISSVSTSNTNLNSPPESPNLLTSLKQPYFSRTRSKSLNLSISSYNQKESLSSSTNTKSSLSSSSSKVDNTTINNNNSSKNNKIEGRKSKSTNALIKSLSLTLSRKGRRDKKDKNTDCNNINSNSTNDQLVLVTSVSPSINLDNSLVVENPPQQSISCDTNTSRNSKTAKEDNNLLIIKESIDSVQNYSYPKDELVEQENNIYSEVEQQDINQVDLEELETQAPKKLPPPLPPRSYQPNSNNSMLSRKFSNMCLIPPSEPVYPNHFKGSSDISEVSTLNSQQDESEIKRNSVELKYIQETHKYVLLEKLGSGTFSDVHLCIHKENQIQYAIKIIDKALVQMIAEHTDFEIKTEVSILQSSAHPNIIQIVDHFETDSYYYIVTELLSGGELLYQLDPSRAEDQYEKKSFANYSEEHAKKVIKQIIHAVGFLHANNIVHRDLKPENILFKEKSDINQLKIIDFGLASYLNAPLVDVLGTCEFQAPEMLKRVEGGYTFSVDIWAIGCILYILLYGHPPFQGRNSMMVISLILKGEVTYSDEVEISKEAKDLLSKMLETDPEKRLTAKQCLEHEWLTLSVPNSPLLGSTFHKQLRRYNSQRYFKATGDTLLKSQRFGIYSSISNDNLTSFLISPNQSPLNTQNYNKTNSLDLKKRKSIQSLLTQFQQVNENNENNNNNNPNNNNNEDNTENSKE